MKKIFFLLLFFTASPLLSQTVPVTFHFRPANKNFTVLRLVGTMNGWNNADNALTMTDADGDGEYSVTVPLTAGTDYAYKFCMDANWSLAYGDPDNPRINTADNDNAMLLVKNPVITYLLPRDKDSKNRVYVDTSKAGDPIRAVIAASADKPIIPESLHVTIDGVALANASQYYNSTKKEFVYQPTPALSVGSHTVSVSIASASGSDVKSTTFTRNPNQIVYKVPVDFFYDANNRTVAFAQALTDVAVVGSFNNWNDSFNPMKNTAGDGVWETTVMLEPDSIEYKFKLNKTAWINDPDMPTISPSSGNNRLAVAADTITSIRLLAPAENQTFAHDTTVNVKILLRPGARSKGIDPATITFMVDGVVSAFTYNTDSTVTAVAAIAGAGRHTIDIACSNKETVSAHQVYSFGIAPSPKGVYRVDGFGDDQYAYPSGVAPGAADILAVQIQETVHHDSLKFTVQMRAIGPRTRLGLLIANPSSGLVDDPRGLELKLPDWNGQGVFASIGMPGSSYLNQRTDNRFMVAEKPAAYSTDSIVVNTDAPTTRRFEFTVSLAFLGRYMGGWTQERECCIFSYLSAADTSGMGYEVGAAEGASASAEDPDIYDAAFIRSTFWQHRLLANYLPSGSLHAALDGRGRGLLPVTAQQISDSLASKETYVTFLTPAVEYWYSNVTLHGTVTDTTLAKITLLFNGAASDYNLTNGKFTIPLVLKEGPNSIFVRLVDTNNVTTTSKELVLTYKPDKRPVVQLSGTTSGRKVSLTAAATSPISEPLSYAWSGDPRNPAALVIPSTSNTAEVTLPAKDGEYIITVLVTDTKSDSAWAKLAVKAAGDSLLLAAADDNYHAGWIDTAVVYEIYPRSFSDQGGFQGVTANIARIKALGVNTVWFMPIFEGPTVHGYETSDYYALESDYGTTADFTTMLAALKQNGIRVILDLVVNHTGITHPFMQNVYKYKEYSPYANFYIWSGEPGASSFQYYFDWSSMPNLNYDNADVRKYVIDVSKYWVQQYGIDGYRCDVAWGVEQRTHTFWNEWRKSVKSVNPDVYLLAEASSSDTTFYQKRFDSAYDWDLLTLLKGVLNGSNKLGDVHRQAVKAYPGFARPFRFAENHDEARVASQFDAQRSKLLHTVIFTLNGIPLIYAGGEVGETTQRDRINWSDPNSMQQYFKRLVQIKKAWIKNPVITRLQNSDTASVYTYSTVSGTNAVVTAANFKNAAASITIDLSTMPFDGTSTYYLTDLMTGTVYPVQASARTGVPLALSTYEARVFYYGLTAVPVSVREETPTGVPTEFVMEQNYPNPFNPSTTLRYGLPSNSRVKLQIFNTLGQVVAELVNGEQAAGWHEVEWNARAASGMYFCRIDAVSAQTPHNRFVQVRKMLLVK